MNKLVVIGAVVAIVALFLVAIVPMWVMTADIGLSPAAWGAIVLMVVGCFGVGGGLMFLIFYSARKGYDDDAHHGAGPRRGDTDGG